MDCAADLERAWAAVLPRIASWSGFDLRECIVLIGFRNGRSVGAIRMSLAAARATTAVAHNLAGLAARFPNGSNVLLITYSSEPRPVADCISALLTASEHAGISLLATLWQSDRHWGDYRFTHRFRVAPEPAASTPEPQYDRVKPFRCHEELHDSIGQAWTASVDSAEQLPARHQLRRAADAVLSRSAPAESIRMVIAALAFASTRDALLLYWALGPRSPSEPTPEAFEQLLLGHRTVAPNARRCAQARLACARLALLTSGESRAAALSTQAWFCWASGEGSTAVSLLERARSEVRGYRFAELLLDYICRGAVPSWAFSRAEPSGIAHC